MAGPGVDAFNDMPDAEATDQLLACLHAPNWAGAVLSGRPYPDRESLLATAYRFGVVTWSRRCPGTRGSASGPQAPAARTPGGSRAGWTPRTPAWPSG